MLSKDIKVVDSLELFNLVPSGPTSLAWGRIKKYLEESCQQYASPTNSASAEILPQIDKILWGNGDSTTKVAKCKDLLAKLRT